MKKKKALEIVGMSSKFTVLHDGYSDIAGLNGGISNTATINYDNHIKKIFFIDDEEYGNVIMVLSHEKPESD